VAHAQRDVGQDSKGAFAAHHHLVHIRAGGCAGIFLRLENTEGSDVFLGDDHIFYLAVIGGVLPGAACDGPAAHTGMLEGLREMPTGVAPLGVQRLWGILQDAL